MSKARVLVQAQLVMTVSAPSVIKRKRGSRLTKNAILTAVLACTDAHVGAFVSGERVDKIGSDSRTKIATRLEDIIRGVRHIAFTWSCTKSFWFLRPTD